jgi:ribosomal protein L11 methyltransferase
MVVVFGLLRTTPAADTESDAGAALLQAALVDYDVSAIEERHGGGWRVFFHTAKGRDRAMRELARTFVGFSFRAEDVPDENWAARSQADLRSVRVGQLIVAPPWDVPAPTDAEVIVIVPSMGFGTGHHATTRLCLDALQRIDLRGRSVIDVGTGSGVLAIAASRLGAASVHAFDDDPDAVHAARENLDLNSDATVALAVADLRTTARPPADLVVANLTGGLLGAAAPQLVGLTRSGGRLILSGFMGNEATSVLAAFHECAVEHRGEQDEWVAVTLQRRSR